MQILKTDCPHCGRTHNVYIQPLDAPQAEIHALRMQFIRAHEALNRCILLAELLAARADDPDPAGTAAEIERARAALKELPQ